MKLFLSLLFLLSNIFSQKLELLEKFGSFSDANSIYISSVGLIYVSDKFSNEVFYFDSLGNLVNKIGGYGWGDYEFDFPVSVFAAPLSILIADYNNNRIMQYDRKLNFISKLDGKNISPSIAQFGYPLSVVTSNQGDLFVLDSDNKRILKFDLFGNYNGSFGGFDAGNLSISNPKGMTLLNDNVFVLNDKSIFVFDSFGNGLYRINLNYEVNNIKGSNFGLIIIGDTASYYGSIINNVLSMSQLNFDTLPNKEKFVDGIIINNKIYMLTPKTIYVYRIVND